MYRCTKNYGVWNYVFSFLYLDLLDVGSVSSFKIQIFSLILNCFWRVNFIYSIKLFYRYKFRMLINVLMPGDNKKVTHT